MKVKKHVLAILFSFYRCDLWAYILDLLAGYECPKSPTLMCKVNLKQISIEPHEIVVILQKLSDAALISIHSICLVLLFNVTDTMWFIECLLIFICVDTWIWRDTYVLTMVWAHMLDEKMVDQG